MRLDLPSAPSDDVTGIQLLVRGNDQRYFVHLRTVGAVRPWQFHRAPFEVSRSWTAVQLPLSAFVAAGGMPKGAPRAQDVTSVGIVAYGRHHDAEIDVRELRFT